MAKSRTNEEKSRNVTTLPVTLQDTEETAESSKSAVPPEYPPMAPPAGKPDTAPTKTGRATGRPPKTALPTETPFFQWLQTIPKEDWGTRVYLYLYVLEPICNLKQSGGKAYLMRYSEPVADEHEIMLQHGSGCYRLMASYNKITPEQGNELRRHEFEVYNKQYPPTIPKEAWIADPRNRKWEALLPKEKPQAATTGLETFVDVMRATNEIRREIREEVAPPTQEKPTATTPAELKTVDPWEAASKILQMRSENPMVDILKSQLEASAKSIEAERQRQFDADQKARDREFKLQQDLLTAKTQAPVQQKGILEQLAELAGALDKFEPLKKLFGLANGSEAAPARPTKMGALDFLAEVLPKVFESPLANAAAAKLMQPGPGPSANQGAGLPGNPAMRPVQPVPPADMFMRFVQEIVTPKMLLFLDAGQDGEDFADWLAAGFPEYFDRIKNFSHPLMPGLVGAPAIINAYKQTAEVWMKLAHREEQFTRFVTAVCAFDPNKEERDEDISQTPPTTRFEDQEFNERPS